MKKIQAELNKISKLLKVGTVSKALEYLDYLGEDSDTLTNGLKDFKKDVIKIRNVVKNGEYKTLPKYSKQVRNSITKLKSYLGDLENDFNKFMDTPFD